MFLLIDPVKRCSPMVLPKMFRSAFEASVGLLKEGGAIVLDMFLDS